MPPKKKAAGGGQSKKTELKKKAQTLEDKTFGLKNKNKSKKVQQFVQATQKSVMNSGDPKQRKLDEQRQKAKADAKARKKAMKDEQDALFGEALLAVKKKTTTDKKEGKIEAKGRDADDGDKKSGTSRAMKMMFQMDAQEMDQKLREDVSLVIWLLLSFLGSLWLLILCRLLRLLIFGTCLTSYLFTTLPPKTKQTWVFVRNGNVIIMPSSCSLTMFQHWRMKLKCSDRKKSPN